MESDAIQRGHAQTEPHIHLFQIAFSRETLCAVEHGFEILDNLDNPRPDWFEYWPIRHFLLSQSLDDDAFYGFFSTKFRSKTGLSAQQVANFVKQYAESADVVQFSPQPDMGAFFLNVFEQAEAFDVGMISTYEAVLAEAGLTMPLRHLVMDSRQTVFSNYFVARPSFWRAWLSLNELIFRLAEDADHPLGVALRAPTNYSGDAQRKVFLQERTASFLLATDKNWKSVRYNPFKLAWSASALQQFPEEAVMSDALKIAFRETNDHEYIEAFNSIRQKIIGARTEARGALTSVPVTSPSPQTSSLESAVSTAEALSAQGLFDEARQLYETYLATSTDGLAFVAHHNLAIVLRSLDLQQDALFHLERSTKLNPSFLLGYLNHGSLLETLERPQDALAVWQAGLEKAQGDDPGNREFRVKLLNNLGRLKEICRDYAGAERALEASLDIEPQQGPVLHHWIHLRQKQCHWPVLGERIGSHQMIQYASPLTILSLTDDPAEQLACAQRFAREKISAHPRIAPFHQGYGHDRIRIGYLSSDLSMHAVSLLTVQLFEMHDRSRFEVHAFCWSPEDGTPFRERVKRSFDKFHPIGAVDDETAANLIRENEIDVLIDLQGLSGRARPQIIARGPAPIQITWLGYPGTTAIPYNDYVIADDFILPKELEPFFTEKPLRLPRLFQVSDTTRAFGPVRSRAFYGLPEDSFVFCAFNNNYKITPEMFESWLRILKSAPNSLLWLLEDNEWSRENLQRMCRAAGVDPARLVFAGRIDPQDYLARFKTADLFLDTAPYNAGTTANDALWAGLPLLTLAGRTYVARMAGSLLRSAGLPELVCHTREDYERKAIHYGSNPAELSELRERLKGVKARHELFDTRLFVHEFETALEHLVCRSDDHPN